MAMLCLIWYNELNFLLLFLLKYILWINWTIHFFSFCAQKFSISIFKFILVSLPEIILSSPSSNSVSTLVYLQEKCLTLLSNWVWTLLPLCIHTYCEHLPPAISYALYNRQLCMSLGFPVGPLGPWGQGLQPTHLYWSLLPILMVDTKYVTSG